MQSLSQWRHDTLCWYCRTPGGGKNQSVGMSIKLFLLSNEIFLFRLFPWTVASMFLRALVSDAHPEKADCAPVDFPYKPKVAASATAALQSNLRDSVTSERKP